MDELDVMAKVNVSSACFDGGPYVHFAIEAKLDDVVVHSSKRLFIRTSLGPQSCLLHSYFIILVRAISLSLQVIHVHVRMQTGQ